MVWANCVISKIFPKPNQVKLVIIHNPPYRLGAEPWKSIDQIQTHNLPSHGRDHNKLDHCFSVFAHYNFVNVVAVVKTFLKG